MSRVRLYKFGLWIGIGARWRITVYFWRWSIGWGPGA